MQALLLLLAFLLHHKPGTGIIMRGHEGKPHSYPYMTVIQVLGEEKPKRCGSILVRKDFVLMAAHCRGSSISMTLGVNNFQKRERTQQVIPMKEVIYHPDFICEKFSNDIMLIKLERKTKWTAAVRPLILPRGKAQVRPEQVCSVVYLGQHSMDTLTTTLQEVDLTVQKDQECESLFLDYYSGATQTCPFHSHQAETYTAGSESTEISTECFIPGKIIGGQELENRATEPSREASALPRNQTRPSPAAKCIMAGCDLIFPCGICVGNPRKRKSTFLGDTGGLLVCHHEAQGIISYGNRMGTPPAVFIRVSSFLPWIMRTMRSFKDWLQTKTPPLSDSSLGQRPAVGVLPEP
ncbi:granzyme H-like [Equus quagga]|uniref:granzyme H-like n=1 Tax=Equus quagga TaxID=89248 RepID=UPI001EE29CBE|nr:granzyme H-like [Equus quagga]